MAYTFFPKSANEIATTLAKKDPEVILEITKLFAHLKANAKIIKVIDTPINIDLTKIKQINISRKLKNITPPLNLATLKTKLKLKKININFGDGSAGGRGVNNKGGKFEKDLGPAFKKMFAGKESSVKDADLVFAYNELRSITSFKDFETLDIDSTAGAANTKRPIQYVGNKIKLYSTSPTFDVGKMLTDTTISGKIGNKTKELYLSLKTTSTVTFFNAGTTQALTTEEIKKGNIKNKNGLALLKMLGVDPAVFCDVYNQPKRFKGYSEEIKITEAKKSKLWDFLQSGIGHGYVVIHQIKKGNVKVYTMTQQAMKEGSEPLSWTVYYGGKTGTGKRVDIVIETNHYTLGLNLRDTQGKDGYPTRIMCNFSYLK
jgi:hypothetical protein